MPLLQISEPGQSPAPHQHRLAVGIDLGTTHSLVATVRSGMADTLPDAERSTSLALRLCIMSAQTTASGRVCGI
jgi:molecular chaperone DnaK (HSP70)